MLVLNNLTIVLKWLFQPAQSGPTDLAAHQNVNAYSKTHRSATDAMERACANQAIRERPATKVS